MVEPTPNEQPIKLTSLQKQSNPTITPDQDSITALTPTVSILQPIDQEKLKQQQKKIQKLKKKRSLLNSETLQIYLRDQDYLPFLRQNPDPQLDGTIQLSEELRDKINSSPCIFCNEIGCDLIYFRESFYKMIANCLNFYAENRISTPWSLIQNKIDIFKPNELFINSFNHDKYKISIYNAQFADSFVKQIEMSQQHQDYEDWFSVTCVRQLQHEKLVYDYLKSLQKLDPQQEQVEVNGELKKFSFGIDFDNSDFYQQCKVCDVRNCPLRLKTGRTEFAFLIKSTMKMVVKNFKDDEKLLDIKNWTHSVEKKAWIFKIEGKVFGEFSEVQFPKALPYFSHIDEKQWKLPEEKIPKCEVCFQFADKLCGACKETSYCSADHQKLHWPLHRSECDDKNFPSHQAVNQIINTLKQATQTSSNVNNDQTQNSVNKNAFEQNNSENQTPSQGHDDLSIVQNVSQPSQKVYMTWDQRATQNPTEPQDCQTAYQLAYFEETRTQNKKAILENEAMRLQVQNLRTSIEKEQIRRQDLLKDLNSQRQMLRELEVELEGKKLKLKKEKITIGRTKSQLNAEIENLQAENAKLKKKLQAM